MNHFFHKELETFRSHLVLMAEKSIDLLTLSLRSLFENDASIIGDAKNRDDEIDQLEMAIDQEAIRYLSLRAPVASDLRLVTVGMKASHELERVGDEATSIAIRTQRLLLKSSVKDFYSIPKMSKIVLEMLRDAIESFLNGDNSRASAIRRRDRKVNSLNRSNRKKITQYVMENPEHSQVGIELIFISKSLERIADHATNIAEEVIFLYSGEDVRHTPKETS